MLRKGLFLWVFLLTAAMAMMPPGLTVVPPSPIRPTMATPSRLPIWPTVTTLSRLSIWPTMTTPGRPTAWPAGEQPFSPPLPAPGGPLFPAVAAAAPHISAAAAVLVDYHTGAVLYEHRMHERRHPASTTKIMTALLTLEYGLLDDQVVVSRRAAAVRGSGMGLRAGDTYTVEALLHGLLLSSGNDAAAALAEHISGTEEKFAALMTERARQLGLANSTFLNAHGLTAAGHMTTAYDLAMLTRYALAMPKFRELVGRRQAEVVDARGRSLTLSNTNQLLWNYEFAEGVKTGTTSAAGKTLVAAASRGGQRLIAVVLRSPGRFYETEELLRWGFDTFDTRLLAGDGSIVGRVPLAGGFRSDVLVKAARPLYVAAPADAWPEIRWQTALPPALSAPVREGQLVGTVTARWHDQVLAAAPVVTADPAVGYSLAGALTLRLLPWLDVLGPRRAAAHHFR